MRRGNLSNQRGARYITRSGIQDPEVQRLIGQAVVNCITGNRSEFIKLCELAAARQRIEIDRTKLHASIRDILKFKGQEVTLTVCQ